MDSDAFRKLGHELVDWVANYRDRLESLPVMSRVKPGEIRARFPAGPPASGGGLPGLRSLGRVAVGLEKLRTDLRDTIIVAIQAIVTRAAGEGTSQSVSRGRTAPMQRPTVGRRRRGHCALMESW